MNVGMLALRIVLSMAGCAILFVPGWWLAGRIQQEWTQPLMRVLLGAGLALVGYLSFVNLVGRLIERSIPALLLWLALNVALGVFLLLRRRLELDLGTLRMPWRAWLLPVGLALVVGTPQAFLAVSTNFWDEANASGIHRTAPNQFAENVFPPRHNAFPDVPIKYHHAFTILSGTVAWATGLSANVSIDVASTALWLLIFLFAFTWFRQLELGRMAATWGAVALVLGGGLAWLYLPHLNTCRQPYKHPPAHILNFKYDAAQSWASNFVTFERTPNRFLHGPGDALSDIPWDITAEIQQHAVPVGMALLLIGVFVLAAWQRRPGLDLPMLAVATAIFGLLPLGHAVFGAIGAAAAGLCLLVAWLMAPSRVDRLARGALFTAGVSVLMFLHGGFMLRGPAYAVDTPAVLRTTLGYSEGGLSGFVHWNIASFGLPLLLTLALPWLRPWRDGMGERRSERRWSLLFLGLVAVLSYMVPQVMYYAAGKTDPEVATEVSKFFYCTQVALALLSAVAIERALRRVHWLVILPLFGALVIMPLTYCWAGASEAGGKWKGLYTGPYHPDSPEEQMGLALRAMKSGPRDLYFDASGDERARNYLNELLAWGGSVFETTPSNFERSGKGFVLSESTVAARFAQDSRVARLDPAELRSIGLDWYYSRPRSDVAVMPLLVRSRFARLVDQGGFTSRASAGGRTLYAVGDVPMDLDRGIERWWQPRVVAQANADWDGDGTWDLVFHDIVAGALIVGAAVVPLPEGMRAEPITVMLGRLDADAKADVVTGRMTDTEFRFAPRVENTVERNAWAWSVRDSASGAWGAEERRWEWLRMDVPLLADLEGDGLSSRIAYNRPAGTWSAADGSKPAGPTMAAADLPFPIAGRFFADSRADLALWGLGNGKLKVKCLADGREAELAWGGDRGDVIACGDFDGDGRDEIGIWQRVSQKWFWRDVTDGPISEAAFGSTTCIPVPADYDHDGRLDLACWEPAEQQVLVSFDQGKSVGLRIVVPPNSVPAWVTMY